MDELRLALRRLAKAVVVITAQDNQVRSAMVATAVSELSMDPPSMLVCVNRAASIHSVLAAKAPFAINILPFARSDVADSCSGAVKGEARFATGGWQLSDSEPPILDDAQASIMCSNERVIDYGTHSIFIGNVTKVLLSGEPDPLVYVDGRYVRVLDESGSRVRTR